MLFKCKTVDREGDNLSPTLFSIFINDLAIEIKNMGLGVSNGNNKVSMLLYADDIAIVSDNETNLQLMLNKLYEWCQNWCLTINTDKSQIVHFRKKRKKRSDFSFSVGPTQLKPVDQYKYLGITLNQNLDYKICAQELTDAGSHALGSLISKFKPYKGIG